MKQEIEIFNLDKAAFFLEGDASQNFQLERSQCLASKLQMIG